MNKFLISLFFICLSNFAICQTAYPYQDVKLNKPSDYKETEPLALSAASFLLSVPFKSDDINRARATQFLTSWMTGASAYQFYMKGKIEEIATDPETLRLYIAAMVKYSLENKNQATNPMLVESKACILLLEYCDNPKNNFRLKKKLRKVLEKK